MKIEYLQQSAENRYYNPMSRIVEQTAAEEWPNTVKTRKELDAALEKGIQSGRSARTVEDIYKAALAEMKNG